MATISSNPSNDGARQYRDVGMPDPVIPTRQTPWFMKALWVLAVLMVVGIGYSFWRISAVDSPTLEVPPAQSTDTVSPR